MQTNHVHGSTISIVVVAEAVRMIGRFVVCFFLLRRLFGFVDPDAKNATIHLILALLSSCLMMWLIDAHNEG